VWLPDGEEIKTLAFFVLTQYQLVTDGQRQTDGRTDTLCRKDPRYHSVARVKTICSPTIYISAFSQIKDTYSTYTPDFTRATLC